MEAPGLKGGPHGQPHGHGDGARPLEDPGAVHVARAEQDALGDGPGLGEAAPLEGGDGLGLVCARGSRSGRWGR